MKRTLTAILAVVLMLALCIPAFAEETTPTGTITINKASPNQTYSIYKMLDLDSYNPTSKSYSYKIIDAWKEFFTSYQIDHSNAYTITDNTYVTWAVSSTVTAKQMEELALAAIAYATEHNIQATATVTTSESDENAQFTGLDLGYYLVESTVGALCGLTTTDPEGVIDAKNNPPTIDKEVKEDKDSSWSNTNDESLFKTISFRTKVTIMHGAKNYVLHDNMSAGLTLDPTSIKVTSDAAGDTPIAATNYTVVTTGEGLNHANDPVTEHQNIVCDFHIAFKKDYLDSITETTVVYAHYTAVLNESAVIGGNGNPNEAWLDYGENSHTTHDQTVTYTYEFDIVKTDTSANLLDGAVFYIYNDSSCEWPLPIKKVSKNLYEVIKFDGVYYQDKASEISIEIEDGGPTTIRGLDGNTTYYLKEVEAPDGYNILINAQSAELKAENNKAVVSEGKYQSGGFQVINKTGSELPETGGLGTTLFITFGSLIAVAAGVLLITKVRMNKVSE